MLAKRHENTMLSMTTAGFEIAQKGQVTVGLVSLAVLFTKKIKWET
jgi:hypothetical protein